MKQRQRNMKTSFLQRGAFTVLSCVCLLAHPFPSMAKAEEIADGNTIYYRLADGTIGNEHWEKRQDDWYYVGADGNVLKKYAIVALDDNYYVFDEQGRMRKDCEVSCLGVDYVIDGHGVATPKLTEEELLLREHAAGLIAQITTPEMTDRQKCDAIYDYLWKDFTFDQTHETDLHMVDAAMKAFDLQRGNCYVLLAKAHYLYQAAGIKDFVVDGFSEGHTVDHWWNMVKLGDHYYHMDCTPFESETMSNLLTTAEFREISSGDKTLRYLRDFDEGNYPKSY